MNGSRGYVSYGQDEQQFKRQPSHIRSRPLSGHLNTFFGSSETKSIDYWRSIMPNSAVFIGFDPVLFGHVITILYKNNVTNMICAVSITKFGHNLYENISIDTSSRFWPACQNLTLEHRNSNVRKALAISNLKNYNKFWNNKGHTYITESWDETNAGSLASEMQITDCDPTILGEHLLTLDFLQNSDIPSLVVDTVYNRHTEDTGLLAENNSLIMLLGKQVEYLFDPLVEYSPRELDYCYIPPISPPKKLQNLEIESMLNELVHLSSQYTHDLMTLVRDFVIPLRAHVLADMSDSTDGDTRVNTRVNTVFSPTLDEFARTNFILNNALRAAIDYGYIEVFIVLSSVLPLFYKVFARHKAIVLSFHARFEKFLKHYRSCAFSDKKIKKHNYTPKIVENIVVGSIFEFTNLKLILRRLYQLVVVERSKSTSFETANDNMDELYASIIETIDALGGEELESAGKSQVSRIFTPSGKLVAELASDWPEELQNGWMNRKVLAIHELKNLISTLGAENEDEILIIFSDHLLFLNVSRSSESDYKFEITDVLMNSLVNQEPLPKLASFPKLKVKYWCKIEQLLVRSYKGYKGQSLSLLTYGDNSFRSRSQAQDLVFADYSMPSEENALVACNSIIDNICKAQILHKSSPFHIFNFQDPCLTRFYCAHDLEAYKGEGSKSPIIILLNMEVIHARDILEQFPQVLVVLNLSFINEHTLQISAYTKENSLDVDEVISIDQINFSLKKILSHCIQFVLHSSFLTEIIIDANHQKLDEFVNWAYEKPNCHVQAEAHAVNVITAKASQCDHDARSEPLNQNDEVLAAPREDKPKSKLYSRMVALWKSKGKSSSQKNRKLQASSNQRASGHDSKAANRRKTVSTKSFKPCSQLAKAYIKKALTFEQEVSYKMNDIPDAASITSQDQLRIPSHNTVMFSRYSASVDVVSDYEFPTANRNLDIIAEELSEIEDTHQLGRRKSFLRSMRHSSTNSKDILSEERPVNSSNFSAKNPNVCFSQVSSEGNKTVYGSQKQFRDGSSYTNFVTSNKSISKKYEFSMDKPVYPVNNGMSRNISGINTAVSIHPSPKNSFVFQLRNLEVCESAIDPKGLKINVESSSKTLFEAGTTETVEEIDNTLVTADDLEKLNFSKVSPRVYSKYKMYDEIPLSVFSTDVEANWTSLARDSLSNLHPELKAMKIEVKERLGSALGGVSGPQMSVAHNFQTQSTPDNLTSCFDFDPHLPDHIFSKAIDFVPSLTSKVSSLSPKPIADTDIEESQLVDALSKRLDEDFGLHLSGLTGSTSRIIFTSPSYSDYMTISNHQKKYANKNPGKEPETSRMTKKECKLFLNKNSDEECSPLEFGHAHELWKKMSAQDYDSDVFSTSSSDKTLMNEIVGSPSIKHSADHWWVVEKVSV